MKPLPDAPPFHDVFKLPAERLKEVLHASQALRDTEYLHWEALRHKPSPPDGLNHLEWWLALKVKRNSSPLALAELTALNGQTLKVTRNARVDSAVARMDRLLAGQVTVPGMNADETTRDRFVASSLMEEAIHSSLFEGAVSTREEAKEMLRSNRKPVSRDERMIINNYMAMTRLRELSQHPLTTDSILELHRILTDGTLDHPDAAGRIQRPDERRISVIDDRVHRVVHSPPPADQLPQRLERLVDFANAPDDANGQFIHPIIRSIALHFMLGYDHPFHDGNGRTARAIFYWSMLRRGYWLAEFFSISRLLYQKRRPYELAFLQVESDEFDATYFVLQQLEVLEQAAQDLFSYVRRKSEAQQSIRRRLQGRDDLNHRQIALLDHALRKPDAIYTHVSHATSHRISVMTARSDLQSLFKRGWLRKAQSGKKLIYQPVAEIERILSSRT